MVKVIQDVWILKEDGRVMFHRPFNKKMDPKLFGGFISALNMFAKQMDKSGLNNFVLGDKNYTILKNNNLIFIGDHDKKHGKKAAKEIKEIVNKFYDTFDFTEIAAWDGDPNYFNKFKDVINDSLEDPVEMLKDSLW